MKLSDEQSTAYDHVTKEFMGERGKAAVLTGAAGTGKTFLCDELAKVLDPALSAMTHKAAAILAKSTGREVATLARILKHRKYNDENTGTTKFVSKGDVSLPFGKPTLFIDESSMMNEDNFNQVQDLVLPNYNVLFIGDKYQLPPVHEEFSLALNQDVPTFSLREPQRFADDSGIAKTAYSIRTAMERGRRDISGMREILAQYDDVQWMSEREAVPLLLADFGSIEDVDDVRMISFTNKRVEQFNYHLKLALTGESAKFQPGDVLMANAAYTQMIVNEEGDKEKTIVLQNNESALVRSVTETVRLGIPCFDMIVNSGIRAFVPINREEFELIVSNLKRKALSYPSGSTERKANFRQMFELQEEFADLRLNYAQTVHKAQGSTYQTCYFDLRSLNSETMMGKKLLYTGVTRAAKRLVLFR